MLCPVCNTEARIKALPIKIKKGDKYYDRLMFECRNKSCASFGSEVGMEDIEFTVTVINENEEVASGGKEI